MEEKSSKPQTVSYLKKKKKNCVFSSVTLERICPLLASLMKAFVCTRPLQPVRPVCSRAGLSLSAAYRLNQSSSGSLQTELALAQSPLEVSTPFICTPFLFMNSVFLLSPVLNVISLIRLFRFLSFSLAHCLTCIPISLNTLFQSAAFYF